VPEARRAESHSPVERDEHDSFRDLCIVCGDFPHLRPVFLGQILLFVVGADKQELAVIRKAIAERAKSPGIGKRRGRPKAADDDELMDQGRLTAWQRHIERKTWREIAQAHGKEFTGQNAKQVVRTLKRQEDYLAASISQAVPPSYVIPSGAHQGELRPGALEHKPFQQLIWLRTGLPFGKHPEQCKRIVAALWPRGPAARDALTDRRMRYLLNKMGK